MSSSPSPTRIAVVTGASAGIGAAIALALAQAGFRVYACARRDERLRDLKKQFSELAPEAGESQSDHHGSIEPTPMDLRDTGAIEALFADLRKREGRIDVLVNNAGLGHSSSLMNGDTEKWREMLDINVLALCVCTREAVQLMQSADVAGHILHISSMSAHRVPDGSGVYSATKFAVRSLTEGLRKELREAKSPIRVTAVSPGFVETEFAANFHQSEAKATETYSRYPVLQPDDIANMVTWLISQPPHVEVHDILVRPTEQES